MSASTFSANAAILSRSRERQALLLAWLASALVPTAALVGPQFFVPRAPTPEALWLLGLSLFLYAYALGVSFLVSYPFVQLLRRRGAIRWWSSALLGAGLCAGVLWLLSAGTAEASRLVRWALLGALQGVLFWAAFARYLRAPPQLVEFPPII